MATPRKTRGEYRPIYEALFHGKDYRRLSAPAKLVLLTVKGLSGAAGLKPWPALSDTLASLTGQPLPVCRKALAELIREGWLQYEDEIVWVVRGLEFEPQISTGAKHRAWLNGVLATLPRAPIIDRFREQYRSILADTPSDRVSIAHRRPPDTLCDTTTPSPSPSPSPSPTADAVVVGVVVGHDEVTDPRNSQHRLRLVVAANKGLEQRFGEHRTPVTQQHGGTTDCAEQLGKAGVPITFAERALFTAASTCRPSDQKPPSSLRYFAGAVVRAWQAEHALRATAVAPTPAPLPDRAGDGQPGGEDEWEQAMRDIADGRFAQGVA